MKDLLSKNFDKYLFQQVKDGLLTLDQLKCRIYEKSNKHTKYYCLDDLRDELDEELLKIPVKEIDQYI